MSSNILLTFWALSISLVIVPGADWAYAISAGIRKKAVVPAVGGMLLGYIVITVTVAAGVGTLVTSIPVMMVVLTSLGAGYLVWIGILTLLSPSIPEMTEIESKNSANWLLKGFAVSGLNPKALLLFVALLPQFTNNSGNWSIPLQLGTLGMVHVLNCALVYTAVGFGSERVLRTRPLLAKRVSQLSGCSMVAVGLCLGFNQLHDFLVNIALLASS